MESDMYSENSKQRLSDSGSTGHGEHRPEIEKAPEIPSAPPKRALTIVFVALLILVCAGAATIVARTHTESALAKETEITAIPYVAVVHPAIEKDDEGLVVPSTLQAYKESPIYARTNGYVINWTKDIGSKVRAGQLLVRIDTPEVDQELLQARAARRQAQAQLQLAKTSDERWQNLRKSDAVSQQEADTQASGDQQAQANVAAADANVHRLEQLESFKNVYAPFSGVITRRNIDQGDLINAGAGGHEMFDIAQVSPIRVFVNVPQAYAAMIKVGTLAEVELQEMPGQRFKGSVARTADAIDPASRTLLTEVDLPNKDGRLLPGAYAQVHFKVNSELRRLTVPVNTMLFRSEGARVAVVGPDGSVRLQPITIGRDYGSSLEVLEGLQPDDQVVINPADSLENGQKVNVAQAGSPADGEGPKQ
jgi:multidrug efflux system membrane fusion protein